MPSYSKSGGSLRMQSDSHERARHYRASFDLSELRALYEPAELDELIDRALAQLVGLQCALDTHLAAGGYVDAGHVLHRMTGTASFFCCSGDALAALHDAQSALWSSDPSRIEAALPHARKVLATLADALAKVLNARSAAWCAAVPARAPSR